MKDNFLFVEKYRPKTIDECILSEDLKKTFNTLISKGEVINLMLSGPPGSGKTTAARAMCEQIGCDYIVVNGSEQRGIDMVRSTVSSFAGTMSTNGKTKVIILDEADLITLEAQAALRNLIESFSSNCRFILTCNFKHKIIEPLHSRCAVIDFAISKKDQAELQLAFAKRVVSILEAESIKFDKLAIVEVIKRFFPDNRRILNELQRYASISGQIDSGIISIVDTSKIRAFVDAIKSGDFKKCREWIANNPDPDSVFNELYENINTYVAPESIPNLILILGEYQFRSASVNNQEINLAAMTVEVMKGVKWR